MYKPPFDAKIQDLFQAGFAELKYELPDTSDEAVAAAAAFPVTMTGLARRFALQARQSAFYDAGTETWMVSHDFGRTWDVDRGNDYTGGLITGILAGIIIHEYGTIADTAERKARRRDGFAALAIPGIHDKVLAAAQGLLYEAYETTEADVLPVGWKARDFDYDASARYNPEDWWGSGRFQHFSDFGF